MRWISDDIISDSISNKSNFPFLSFFWKQKFIFCHRTENILCSFFVFFFSIQEDYVANNASKSIRCNKNKSLRLSFSAWSVKKSFVAKHVQVSVLSKSISCVYKQTNKNKNFPLHLQLKVKIELDEMRINNTMIILEKENTEEFFQNYILSNLFFILEFYSGLYCVKIPVEFR